MSVVRCLLLMVFLSGAIAGCSSGLTAVADTVIEAVRPAGAPGVQLDPRFQYIRVTVGGRSAFLALGNEEQSSNGPIQVYYSAKKEVLEFQDGRLAGTAGLTTEWRNVTLLKPVSWRVAADENREVEWFRKRDVMPGYRYGVEDRLILSPVAVPRKTALERIDATLLTWFEERMTTNVPDAAFPPALYGVDMRGGREEVVYGEQCVSEDLCFTWQRWDPKMEPQMNVDKHR